MGVRDIQKEKRRKEILEAGLDLFIRKGYAATKIKDIADQVGMDESFSTALGDAAVGTYACVNYFNSIDSDANKTYLAAYAAKYGADSAKAVTAVGEATYDAVYLLSKSLEKCGDNITTDSILSNFDNLSFDAPQGTITVDPETHHIFCKALIGLVQDDGTFKIVYESDDLIKPEPTK